MEINRNFYKIKGDELEVLEPWHWQAWAVGSVLFLNGHYFEVQKISCGCIGCCFLYGNVCIRGKVLFLQLGSCSSVGRSDGNSIIFKMSKLINHGNERK